MGIFKKMNFTSSSGIPMSWKIECDALDDEDIECLAHMAIALLEKFKPGVSMNFVGVPRGGVRLAEKMQSISGHEDGEPVIIDDVLTTGRNVAEAMEAYQASTAVVIFARRPCPGNVHALFQSNWFLDLPDACSASLSGDDDGRDGW